MHLILTQCFPPTIGGIENLIGELANALAQQGDAVLVLADGKYTSHDDNQPYRIRRFGGWKIWRKYQKAKFAAHFIKTNSQPVRHIFCDSWKSLESLELPDCDAVVSVFAHGSEYPKTPTANKKRRIIAALAHAHRVLAVSNAARRRMQQCGINTESVRIWHPPIGNLCQANPELVAPLWQNGHPKILSIARLAKRKGIDIAIDAVRKLVAHYPQVRYVIGGEGREEDALRAQVRRHQLDSHVIFAGAVSDAQKAALYASADIFVLPAREHGDDMEGFGIVFLEAGFYGLPAICGNSGGATEAVVDGISGIHCDGEDADAICQAMLRILSDDELRKTFSTNAKQNAANNVWEKRVLELL